MKNNSERTGELNTIVGKDSYFEGNLKVKQTVRVDGTINGDVETSEALIIGKDGKVTGNVSAKKLIVGGSLSGNVKVEGRTVLENEAVFDGELATRLLVIDEGATFDGKCSMSKDKSSVKPPGSENSQ